MSSFATDINTLLKSDASINAIVDGGIHYENFEDNWLAKTDDDNWVVYTFNKSNQTNCLQEKNVFMTYTLNIILIQRDSNTNLDILTDLFIDFLNGYESQKMIDLTFLRDSGGFDQQKGVYTNNLEFLVTYLES